MNTKFSFSALLALIFLSSCQHTSQLPQNTETSTGQNVSQAVAVQSANASTTDWSQAKFSHEDVDFFVPSDQKISLPENIDAKTLFLKPFIQGENTKIRFLALQLDGGEYQVPVSMQITPPEGYTIDMHAGLGIVSQGKDIFATVYNKLADDPSSASVDNPDFATNVKMPNQNGKVEKMWKFSSPENRQMHTEMKYYNMMNYTTLAEKIVIDVSEVGNVGFEEWFQFFVNLPIYSLANTPSENVKSIIPKNVKVTTKTGETFSLRKATDIEVYRNIGNNEVDYLYSCNPNEFGYVRGCNISTSSKKWLKNIATIEAEYDPEDIEKIKNFAQLSNFALYSPDWYADENNRAERKGIFYHSKLPFTLPEKPKDGEALLVFDAKNLHKQSSFASVSGWFDAKKGVGAVNAETVSQDDDAKMQIDSFFFFPNAQKSFLMAMMDFVGHGAIKGKVKYLKNPSAYEKHNYNEKHMTEVLITKEGDFYHTQTEQKPGIFSQQIFDSSVNETSSIKTFIFDLSRLKNMWQENDTKHEQAIEFFVEVPSGEQSPYKPQNAVVTFHDEKIQELSLEKNSEKASDNFKTQGVIFREINDYYPSDAFVGYVVRISPQYAKNVARIEIKFE